MTDAKPARLPDLPLDPAEPPDAESPRGKELRDALTIVTITWMFGSVWLTAVAGAPLTLFARHLGCTEFQLGVLAALPFMAQLVSMPASVLIERTAQRKRIFLTALYSQRLLWFPIAIVPWLLLGAGAPVAAWASVAFLGMVFVMHAGQAVGGPAWVSWMADIVPDRSRGKYFSRRRQWGIVSAIPTALLVGWLLDRHAGGGGADGGVLTVDASRTLFWCAAIFCGAAVFGVADIALFHFVREPKREPDERAGFLNLFRQPMRDRKFLVFGGFVATMMFAVSFMGQFVTLYMIERLKITATATQMMLLVAPMLAQLLVLHLWGSAVDRMGKRPVLALAGLGLVPVGIGWIFVSPEAIWLGYLLSAAGAALWAGVETANFNFVLEFCDGDDERPVDGSERRGSAYVAVNAVFINFAGCLGGLSAGVVASVLRDWRWESGVPWMNTFTYYEVLFLISAALRLVAVGAFLPFMHEPTARRTHETLLFMTANFYNNLVSAAAMPIKLLRQLRAAGFSDRP